MAVGGHVIDGTQAFGSGRESGVSKFIGWVKLLDELVILGTVNFQYSICPTPVFDVVDIVDVLCLDAVAILLLHLVHLLVGGVIFAAFE